jgi:hypothetical protein
MYSNEETSLSTQPAREANDMATSVWGIVKEGLVVPDAPLPEGARVEIVLPDVPVEVPPELRAEFDAWDRASAESLDLVERMAREGETDDPR